MKKTKEAPNIIFIALDGVRAKSLSCYGNKRVVSPHIDRFSRDCVIYKNAFSAGNTSSSSHTSLLTGLYPSEHGTCGDQPFLKKTKSSLACVLKEAGYRTVMVNSVYLMSDYFGHTAGFDRFFQTWQYFTGGFNENIFRDGYFLKLGRPGKCFYILKNLLDPRKIKGTFKSVVNKVYSRFFDIYKDSSFATRKTINLAIAAIKKNRKIPFFLYLNLLEAHEEYNPPKKTRAQFSIPAGLKSLHQIDLYGGVLKAGREEFAGQLSLYEAEISFLDKELGRLLDFTKASGIYNDTMIIITSDHGAHFGEKGHFGNLFSLYNEIIHVPLLIKYPANISVGPKIATELAQTTDIYATVLELSGAPRENGSFSLLRGKKRTAVFSELVQSKNLVEELRAYGARSNKEKFNYGRSLYALIRNDGYKYIYSTAGGHELYNIFNDYGEEKNLINEPDYENIRKELQSAVNENKKKWAQLTGEDRA